MGFTAQGLVYAISNVNRDKAAISERSIPKTIRKKDIGPPATRQILATGGYSKKNNEVEYAMWDGEKPHIYF